MNSVRAAILALWALAGAAWAAAPSAITLDQYREELDGLIAAADRLSDHPEEISKVLDRIPETWRVENADRTFELSGRPLRQALDDLEKDPDAERLRHVREHLVSLGAEAKGFAEPAADFQESRARLSEILARSEFRNVHGQTWQERLRQTLWEWLIWLLGGLFASSTIPTISTLLVYALVILAFVVLSLWVYRAIRKAAVTEEEKAEPLPVSAKEWSVWLAEAREEAERGNWANAIHLAYWAGISLLEAQGTWRPDKARTPREYLRLLPSSSEHHPALTALTRGFEVVWYGGHAADADSFAQTMTHLEKLGCR